MYIGSFGSVVISSLTKKSLRMTLEEAINQQWLEVDERRKTSPLNVQWVSYERAIDMGVNFWLVAESEEEGLLGYISVFLTPSMHTGELTALTDTIYVLPNGRGKGVGKELLKASMLYAKSKGAVHFMATFKNNVDHSNIANDLGMFNYETLYCKEL